MSVAAPERPRADRAAGYRAGHAAGATAPPPAVRPEPGRTPSRRAPGRHLRPVDRRRRRSTAVPAVVAVGIVIAALFGLAVMHALLIGGQVQLDALRRDAAAEHEAIRRLQLEVAELESPGRILDVARARLGMVQPTEVGYLTPVTPGEVAARGAEGETAPAAERVRVEAATAAPPTAAPPTTVPAETRSPEEDAVAESGVDVDAGTTSVVVTRPDDAATDADDAPNATDPGSTDPGSTDEGSTATATVPVADDRPSEGGRDE